MSIIRIMIPPETLKNRRSHLACQAFADTWHNKTCYGYTLFQIT